MPEILIVEPQVDPIPSDHTGYEQTRTAFADKYDHNDLEGANQHIKNWYTTKVQPALNDHRDFVYRYYLGMNEDAKAPLLDTCKMGTKCRIENEDRMKTEIAEEWKKVMKSFKEDVETTLVKTESIVNEGWDVAVQCELDHPCCEFNTIEWDNIQKKIENHVNTIIEKQKQVKELQRRISEMKTKCEAFVLPWGDYDARALQMDADAAAAGIDVNDDLSLDEELF